MYKNAVQYSSLWKIQLNIHNGWLKSERSKLKINFKLNLNHR